MNRNIFFESFHVVKLYYISMYVFRFSFEFTSKYECTARYNLWIYVLKRKVKK